MLSVEGRELPVGVTNIYWFWNKEHAFDARKKEHRGISRYGNFYKTKTKEQRQAWWNSLTKQQQEEYRNKKILEKKFKKRY